MQGEQKAVKIQNLWGGDEASRATGSSGHGWDVLESERLSRTVIICSTKDSS